MMFPTKLASAVLLFFTFATSTPAVAVSNDMSSAKGTQVTMRVISEFRHLETKSSRKKKKSKKKKKKKIKSIASIRDGAIKSTLKGIRALRPYSTNYKRMKAAVRRYWKRNVKRPTTNGLAKTIMRYVKRKSRSLVKSQVYSGAKSGVRKVKKQLKKRKT